MALRYPPPVVCAPKSAHTATVFMMHGLGDSGDGWADIGSQFAAHLPHVKFVFPTAPERPVTVNFGMKMNAWFDIVSLGDINQQEDSAGLMESKRFVEELVQAEVAAGIPSERIVAAGFSQGGAVALLMLRSDFKLAAVVGLSSFLPLRNQPPVLSDANKSTPVLLCHGMSDNVVKFGFGKESADKLEQLGAKVTFKSYPGLGHSACPPEMADFVAFLKAAVP